MESKPWQETEIRLLRVTANAFLTKVPIKERKGSEGAKFALIAETLKEHGFSRTVDEVKIFYTSIIKEKTALAKMKMLKCQAEGGVNKTSPSATGSEIKPTACSADSTVASKDPVIEKETAVNKFSQENPNINTGHRLSNHGSDEVPGSSNLVKNIMCSSDDKDCLEKKDTPNIVEIDQVVGSIKHIVPTSKAKPIGESKKSTNEVKTDNTVVLGSVDQAEQHTTNNTIESSKDIVSDLTKISPTKEVENTDQNTPLVKRTRTKTELKCKESILITSNKNPISESKKSANEVKTDNTVVIGSVDQAEQHTTNNTVESSKDIASNLTKISPTKEVENTDQNTPLVKRTRTKTELKCKESILITSNKNPISESKKSTNEVKTDNTVVIGSVDQAEQHTRNNTIESSKDIVSDLTKISPTNEVVNTDKNTPTVKRTRTKTELKCKESILLTSNKTPISERKKSTNEVKTDNTVVLGSVDQAEQYTTNNTVESSKDIDSDLTKISLSNQVVNTDKNTPTVKRTRTKTELKCKESILLTSNKTPISESKKSTNEVKIDNTVVLGSVDQAEQHTTNNTVESSKDIDSDLTKISLTNQVVNTDKNTPTVKRTRTKTELKCKESILPTSNATVVRKTIKQNLVEGKSNDNVKLNGKKTQKKKVNFRSAAPSETNKKAIESEVGSTNFLPVNTDITTTDDGKVESGKSKLLASSASVDYNTNCNGVLHFDNKPQEHLPEENLTDISNKDRKKKSKQKKSFNKNLKITEATKLWESNGIMGDKVISGENALPALNEIPVYKSEEQKLSVSDMNSNDLHVIGEKQADPSTNPENISENSESIQKTMVVISNETNNNGKSKPRINVKRTVVNTASTSNLHTVSPHSDKDRKIEDIIVEEKRRTRESSHVNNEVQPSLEGKQASVVEQMENAETVEKAVKKRRISFGPDSEWCKCNGTELCKCYETNQEQQPKISKIDQNEPVLEVLKEESTPTANLEKEQNISVVEEKRRTRGSSHVNNVVQPSLEGKQASVVEQKENAETVEKAVKKTPKKRHLSFGPDFKWCKCNGAEVCKCYETNQEQQPKISKIDQNEPVLEVLKEESTPTANLEKEQNISVYKGHDTHSFSEKSDEYQSHSIILDKSVIERKVKSMRKVRSILCFCNKKPCICDSNKMQRCEEGRNMRRTRSASTELSGNSMKTPFSSVPGQPPKKKRGSSICVEELTKEMDAPLSDVDKQQINVQIPNEIKQTTGLTQANVTERFKEMEVQRLEKNVIQDPNNKRPKTDLRKAYLRERSRKRNKTKRLKQKAEMQGDNTFGYSGVKTLESNEKLSYSPYSISNQESRIQVKSFARELIERDDESCQVVERCAETRVQPVLCGSELTNTGNQPATVTGKSSRSKNLHINKSLSVKKILLRIEKEVLRNRKELLRNRKEILKSRKIQISHLKAIKELFSQGSEL